MQRQVIRIESKRLAGLQGRGPRVEIDGQRLFVQTTIFSRRSVAWGDVVGLTRTSRGVDLTLARGGAQSFDLTDAVNRDASPSISPTH